MPPEDARALLLRIAPRIGEQAERIAAVCAGVPLALRQAAGTLAERPDLSPASYASRLESGKAKLGHLREIGHPDAEEAAARVEALRGRMGAG